MPTLTCHCGKRFTVGLKAGRETVDCPECGEAVAVNGAAEPSAPLTFGVKVVDRRETEIAGDERTIAFSCPGCGKEFVESRRAAGKPTQCPKCAMDFVIPAEFGGRRSEVGGRNEENVGNRSDLAPPSSDLRVREPAAATTEAAAGPEALRSLTLPARPPTAPPKPPRAESPAAGVDAAVAAYAAGKSPSPRARLSAGRKMVLIGFLLILLGGAAGIVGSVMMVAGVQDVIIPTEGAMKSQDHAMKQTKVILEYYNRVFKEAFDQNGGRRGAIDPPPQLKRADEAMNDLQTPVNEQRSSGKSKLVGGVIAGGVGMLLSFIGGIFLLAGLIGRFLQPQPPMVELQPNDVSNPSAGTR